MHKIFLLLTLCFNANIFCAAEHKAVPSFNCYIEALKKGPQDASATRQALEAAQQFVSQQQSLETLHQGSTLLGWAAIEGNQTLVEFLCKNGAQVNQRLRSNSTALHAAASSGCTKTVSTLLAYEADPKLKDTAEATPLHKALISEHSAVAILLINAGSPIDTTDNFGNTPLSLAEANELSDVIALLK